MNSYQKKKFNSLYTKFQQALTLHGYSKTTYDNYSRGIRRLADWCDRCPDQRLTQEDFIYMDVMYAGIAGRKWRLKLISCRY